jgi:hypothetical protein
MLLFLPCHLWKCLLDFLYCGVILEPSVCWELDVDNEIQVALGIAALHGHALAWDLEDLARAQDLSFRLLNVELDAATIEMGHNHPVEAGEGFCERDLELGTQICSSALECVVWRLFQRKDDVSGLLVWQLVGLASQRNAFALTCAAGNVEFENVLGFDNLFALALLAARLFWDDFARALAVATGDGFLGNKAGANLTENLLGT